MKARRYQITPPEKAIDHKEGTGGKATIAAAANGSAETVVGSFVNSVQIDAAVLTLDAAIGAVTPGSVGAHLYLNVYRAGQQLGNDGFLGLFPFGAVANTLAKAAQLSLTRPTPLLNGGLGPFSFVGTLTGAVIATATTLTVSVIGSGTTLALTSLESTAILNGGTFTLVVEPGVAGKQEAVTVTAFNTGTGVTTNSAFVNAHAAGVPVVVLGAYLFQGTQAGAMVANTTTGGTLVAVAPSALTQTQVAVGALLTIEPGTSNAETFPIATYNSGTGVYTIAASYNSAVVANAGKCALAHAAGAAVAVLDPSPAWELNKGDVIAAKYCQTGTTGLALPAYRVDLDYSFSGYRY